MNRILCSTGALIGRPNGRNIELLRQCVEKLNCDGFEFMMYSTWHGEEERVVEFLNGLPASFPVMHCEKGVGEHISRNEPGDSEEAIRLFRINCEIARDIGSKIIVLHLWNGLHSDRDIGHNLSLYPALRDIADRHGLCLAVENVVCNHEDPMTHLHRVLKADPGASFTFDTKMAQFHEQMDALYAPENDELFRHIAHFHINDYRGGVRDWSSLRTLHPGDGQVDFDRLFGFLTEKGYRGDFTVEATSFGADGVIDFDALNRDFDGIRSLINRREG